MQKHIPVMLQEIIKALNIKSDGVYVDLTLGRGGHASAILQKLVSGQLLAFDKDKAALQESAYKLSSTEKKITLIHSDYKNLKHELTKRGFAKVDGIIADLGVSSPQLDNPARGFSYNKNARLDMRMNQQQILDAYQIVNFWSEDKLVKIFKNYADVKLPRRVAKGIITKRPITTTLQLVEVIKQSLPAAIVRKKNPAKTVFQAIRIAVNDELTNLQIMLNDAISCLNKNGVLAIITFHSLEDILVRNSFHELIRDDTGKLPIIVEKKFKARTIKPSQQELVINPRSRSAKLRILQKI